MIESFRDAATADLYHGRENARVRRFHPSLRSAALRRLDSLDAAKDLNDLRANPGNRIEELKRDLKGFLSIRVNDQWRVIFRWHEGNAVDVMLTDYH